MATPDRRDENGQRREIEDLEPRPGWHRRGGGLAWWWVWILLIGIAFFWFAGWGWGPYGGWWWGQPEVRMQPQVTGSGVGVLDSNNRIAYVGKSFDLRNATVERQVNERVFWIGKANALPMLLVVTGNANSNMTQSPISAGDLIAARGTVQKAPPEMQAKQEWNLTDEGAHRLEHQQAYLQTAYVAKLQKERTNRESAATGSAAAKAGLPSSGQ